MYKRIILPLLLTLLLASCAEPGAAGQMGRYSLSYDDSFDTVISLIGYAESAESFGEMAELMHEEFRRYDRLFDIYSEDDLLPNLAYINAHAGEAPIATEPEIIELLSYGKEVYELTDGKVNMAMGAVLSLWHEAREMEVVPQKSVLQEAALHCNIEDLVIDEAACTVHFTDPSLKIDVGAIAKGYACEKVAKLLESKGYTDFIINAGGNIRTSGNKADGSGSWVIGLENPDPQGILNETEKPLFDGEPYFDTTEARDEQPTAVATSGVYQRYYIAEDGKIMHHIIDPETLYPREGYLSVSVITDDAGLADSLSTALFNLSEDEGRRLLNEIESGERKLPEAAENAAEGSVTAKTKAKSEINAVWVYPDGSVTRYAL